MSSARGFNSGGEGSLTSASDPLEVRRRGDGVRGSIMWVGEESLASEMRPGGNGLGGEGSSVSTIRPAGNGRGEEGSLASSSPSVRNRDRARGTLSSSTFPCINGYLEGKLVTTKG